MGRSDAEIRIGADADDVKKAAAEAKAAWSGFGSELAGTVASAARSVAMELGNVVLQQGKVSFSSQLQQVRDFESATAHLAVSSGQGLEAVRASYESTGLAIGKRPGEVAAWAGEMNRLTYSSRGAEDSMRALSGLASYSGRNVEEYRTLGAELGIMGVRGKDTAAVIGTMKAQADALGTSGGVSALTDQFASLDGIVTHFAETTAPKMTALLGVLGKGVSAPVAQRAESEVLGKIASDPMGWSRYLGRDVLDEHGQIKDPGKVLQDVSRKMARDFGSGKELQFAMRMNFGAEGGSQLYNAYKSGDLGRLDSLAMLKPSSDLAAAQQKYNATDAGQRDIAGAELAKSSRDLFGSSTKLGHAADALQKFSASHPVTSTFASTAAGSALGVGLSKGGGAAGSLVKTAAAGASSLGGASGFLAKAGLVGAAGALGYGIGSYADSELGISDWISGTGEHSRIKARADRDDVAVNAALAKRVAEIRAQNAARHASGGQPVAGAPAGSAELHLPRAAPAATAAPARHASGGQPVAGDLAAAVAKAVSDALKGLTVINATGGPVQLVQESSSSSAAGAQSHP